MVWCWEELTAEDLIAQVADSQDSHSTCVSRRVDEVRVGWCDGNNVSSSSGIDKARPAGPWPPDVGLHQCIYCLSDSSIVIDLDKMIRKWNFSYIVAED